MDTVRISVTLKVPVALLKQAEEGNKLKALKALLTGYLREYGIQVIYARWASGARS